MSSPTNEEIIKEIGNLNSEIATLKNLLGSEGEEKSVIGRLETTGAAVDRAKEKLENMEQTLDENRFSLGGLYLLVLIIITIRVFWNDVSQPQATVMCFAIAFGALIAITLLATRKSRHDGD